MTNTAAKGRNFEYEIRDMFLRQCYIVGRCAASKPWDLTVATEKAVYAVECKANTLSDKQIIKVYNDLKEKLTIRRFDEDGKRTDYSSKLLPLLFFKSKIGSLRMYTEVFFKDDEGIIYRPYFINDTFREIYALGENKDATKIK